jgi:hypothetical protein
MAVTWRDMGAGCMIGAGAGVMTVEGAQSRSEPYGNAVKMMAPPLAVLLSVRRSAKGF